MNILLVDNYGSFTRNLYHALKEAAGSGSRIEIVGNDAIDMDAAGKYDGIVLSPGPGIPSEAGALLPLIRRYAPTHPMLGICLGHQAIAEAFGGRLVNDRYYHGVRDKIDTDDTCPVFAGIGHRIDVGRYHSWLVERESLPRCLTVTAADAKGAVMAISHETYNVHGIQFHPESIMTPDGTRILRNFLNTCGNVHA